MHALVLPTALLLIAEGCLNCTCVSTGRFCGNHKQLLLLCFFQFAKLGMLLFQLLDLLPQPHGLTPSCQQLSSDFITFRLPALGSFMIRQVTGGSFRVQDIQSKH